MNYSKMLAALIFCCFLFTTSCERDLKKSTHHPYQNTHEYPDPTSSSPSAENGDIEMEEGNRWIWQKPQLVIERLGDLDNKVVADVGAGPYGYFSFRIAAQTNVRKVIALDIDPKVNEFIDDTRNFLPEGARERIETRLVEPNDPKLKEEEVDMVLMVNISFYLEDRIDYFKKLQSAIVSGGKIVIIDFKKRNTPIGPAISERIALGEIEAELKKAGYKNIKSDDRTLDYQYIITAKK